MEHSCADNVFDGTMMEQETFKCTRHVGHSSPDGVKQANGVSGSHRHEGRTEKESCTAFHVIPNNNENRHSDPKVLCAQRRAGDKPRPACKLLFRCRVTRSVDRVVTERAPASKSRAIGTAIVSCNRYSKFGTIQTLIRIIACFIQFNEKK